MEQFYRPTIAKIHIDNLIYNYRQFKKLLGTDIEIAPVVKADAYGHGAVECASALAAEGVKSFCVAFFDEGLELREAGITQDILLMGSTLESWADQIIEYDLIPAVFEYNAAKSFSIAAKKKNTTCNIHIKVDTGMGRIGFNYKDAVKEIQRISKLENVKIQGIFTHYASADEKDKEYTYLQKQRFLNVTSELKEIGIEIPKKHCANSAGSIDLNQKDMDMIRLGISLYGYYPSEEVEADKVKLKPVMQLETEIAYIKTVHNGDSISYNRRFTASGDMIVGTLPIGYADGYRREFRNKAYIEIKGRKALVLGTVCMDQTMVDLTDIKEAKKGDKAILFGPGLIGADELAKIADTISYEILCGISKRVPRIYIR